MSFELNAIAPDKSLVQPPMLTGSDILAVKAETKSAWYMLSGRHSTSKVVLTVKPASLGGWLARARAVTMRGDRIALVLDGKSVGEMTLMQSPTDSFFEIDAAFYSSGNEERRADATRKLVKEIKASLK
ncbi:MAG: hypothetical protein ABJB74_06575 [Gemmatimonas sp.]